jgi:TRAP-type uncharacterized transport system substrate-binding protein
MKRIGPTVLILALSSLAASAHGAVEERIEPTASCALKIATGKRGKGFSKLFADIKAVCGSEVSICEVETEGGLQNLTTIAANQADLGFAQIDTLQDLKVSDQSIGAMLAVMSLNSNLLHIVASTGGFVTHGQKRLNGWLDGERKVVTVDRMQSLKGLRVALVGSAQALGRVVDRREQLSLTPVDVDTDEQGLAMVRSGEVAAMFSTSGWPSGPVGALRRDSKLRVIPYDGAAQAPYQVMRKNYPNLGVYDNPFLSVPNLLITRPFRANGPNGRNVATLQRCIVKNLPALQEGRFEPAWQEVKKPDETYGWPRFVPSAAY